MESNMVTIPCDKLKEMQSEIATLTAKLAESEKQLAEAMKDAGRYRWLRDDQEDDGLGVWRLKDSLPVERGWLTHEELDEAIDAAIRAMKEE